MTAEIVNLNKFRKAREKAEDEKISLEAAFWDALKDAAAEDRVPLAALVATIDKDRGTAGLSSAVRVWLLQRLRERAQKLRNAAE